MHRAENVDVPERLGKLTAALSRLSEHYGLPVVVSTHPRTRARMQQFGFENGDELIRYLPPFGFFDFLQLERNAFCMLSDSGTVQEECAILRVANVTIRDVTERPETIECGSNILSGAEPDMVVSSVRTVLATKPAWTAPPEYLVGHVSDTVIKILMGYRHR